MSRRRRACALPSLTLFGAGTLAKPFFKRRSDGNFFYESGAEGRLAGARAPRHRAQPAWRVFEDGGSTTAPLVPHTAASQLSIHTLGQLPCYPANRFLSQPRGAAEAQDDEDGMSMLVNLEGAAAAAAASTVRDGVNAAGAEGPAPAEEGARVKVTFSHFQARHGRQQRAPHEAPRGCCCSASGGPTLLVSHLTGCVGRGAAGRPAAVPAVRVRHSCAPCHPLPSGAPAGLHVPPPAEEPTGRGAAQGGLQRRAGLAGKRARHWGRFFRV